MSEERAEYQVQSTGLSAEERAELRRRHVRCKYRLCRIHRPHCEECEAPHPCPTVRAVDALERQAAEIRRLLVLMAWSVRGSIDDDAAIKALASVLGWNEDMRGPEFRDWARGVESLLDVEIDKAVKIAFSGTVQP